MDIKLGYVVKLTFEEPTLSGLYIVDYIDEDIIEVKSTKTTLTLKRDSYGDITNYALRKYKIVKRPDKPGYAEQNGLIPDTWVNINFGGDDPFVVFGRVLSNDDDILEVEQHKTLKRIYIGFQYQGIPKKEPQITRIEIRGPPAESAVGSTSPTDADEFTELILDADQVKWGEELQVMQIEVEKSDAEMRYSLEIQQESLRNSILHEIITSKVTNTLTIAMYTEFIARIIDSYTNLHRCFSQITPELEYEEKTREDPHSYKPLARAFFNMHFGNAPGYIPVVYSKRNLYDINIRDVPDDIVNLDHKESIKLIADLHQKYHDMREETTKFLRRKTYLEELQNVMSEHSPTVPGSLCLITADVKDDVDVLVNNAQGDKFEASTSFNNGDNVVQIRLMPYRATNGFRMLQRNEEEKRRRYEYINILGDVLCIRSLLRLTTNDLVSYRDSIPSSTIAQKVFFQRPLLFRIGDIHPVQKFQDSANIVEFIPGNEELSSASWMNYLERCVPNIFQAYDIIPKNQFTIASMTQPLEIFHFHSDDLNNELYEKICTVLKKNVANLKAHVASRRTATDERIQQYNASDIANITHPDYISPEQLQQLLAEYKIVQRSERIYETLSVFQEKDSMGLFLALLAKENLHLHNPALIDVLQQDIDAMQITPTPKDKECSKQPVLAKTYHTQASLDQDQNNLDVFFDKEHDPTRYEIEEEHKDARNQMNVDQYRNHLANHFETVLGLEDPLREANSIIQKRRSVYDGEYAVLGDAYYIRKDNAWVLAPKVNAAMFQECALENNCVKSHDDCSSMETAYKNIEMETLRTLIFNEMYDIEQSKQNTSERIDRVILDYRRRIHQIEAQKRTAILKAEAMYGVLAESIMAPKSPYIGLRDAILRQTDFLKRQINIRLFAEKCTRKGRDPWWLLCNRTGEKLLPAFLLRIANAVMSDNPDDYTRAIREICRDQGAEGGGMWVDKHSGYPIAPRAYDVVSTFDKKGKVVTTNEVIVDTEVSHDNTPDVEVTNDILSNIRNIENIRRTMTEFELETMRIIANVTMAMFNNMGIQPDGGQLSSIVLGVIDVMKTKTNGILNRQEWEARMLEKRKKELSAKKADDWVQSYNLAIMRYTLGYIVLQITIRIPSYTSPRVFGTCYQSFDGFPVNYTATNTVDPENPEEVRDCLNYVCCIAHSMRKSVAPWSSLQRYKLDTVKAIVRDLLTQEWVVGSYRKQIQQKETYLKSRPPQEKQETRETQGLIMYTLWPHFLPHLKPIILNGKADIPNTREELDAQRKNYNRHIQSGSNAIWRDIGIFGSIVRSVSMQIQKRIQDIILQESPLLLDGNHDAYIINSCCIKTETNVWNFFLQKDQTIKRMNGYVKHITREYLNHFASHASYALCLNTPRNDVSIRTVYSLEGLSDEKRTKIIYEVIINACNLMGLNKKVPKHFVQICKDRKGAIAVLSKGPEDRVQELRKIGYEFGIEHLEQILRKIPHTTIKPSKFARENYYTQQNVRRQTNPRSVVDDEYLKLQMVDGLIEEYRMKLAKEYRVKLAKLQLFVGEDKKAQQLYLSIERIVLCKLKPTGDGDFEKERYAHTRYEFLRGCVDMAGSSLPAMLLNGVIQKKMPHGIPSYWNLSKLHVSDIESDISQHFKPLLSLTADSEKGIYKHILKDLIKSCGDVVAFLRNSYGLHLDRPNSVFSEEYALLLVKYALVSIFYYLMSPREDEEFTRNDLQKAGIEISKAYATYFLSLISVWDYNYDEIIQNKDRLHYTDRNRIARKFTELSDENRRLQNELKMHKLGEWNVNVRNGIQVYNAEAYDKERAEDVYNADEMREVGDEDFTRKMYAEDYVPPEYSATAGPRDADSYEDEDGYSDGDNSENDGYDSD